MPATLSTLTVVFAPQDRAKAIAVLAGFAGAGGALGPLLSGLLLERFWWGSVFFIAAPIAAVLLVAIVLVVPNSADPARHRLDYVGSLLSVVALVSIVFAIIEGPAIGWLDPVTVGAFVLGTVVAVGFVLWELSREHPLLDPRLFLHPPVRPGQPDRHVLVPRDVRDVLPDDAVHAVRAGLHGARVGRAAPALLRRDDCTRSPPGARS